MSVSPAVIAAPSDRVLDLLDCAFARPYGALKPGPDGNGAFIPAMADIRRVVLPALRRGEKIAIHLRHGTTFVAVINAYESAILDQFPGTRSVQRSAVHERDSKFLDTVTEARKWAQSPTFTLSTGGLITL